MPRILVITGELPLPSETFVVAHLKGMRDRGWEVAAAAYHVHRDALEQAFDGAPPQVFELEPRAQEIRGRNRIARWWALRKVFGSDADALFHPGAGKNQRSRAAALLEVCREWTPDVMHAQFGPHGLTAAPAAKRLGIPLTINFRGYDFLKYPREAGWDAYDYFPESAIAIGHTEFCEDILRSHLKIRVEHVRRGVDRTRFHPPDRANTWGETVRLLIVGRLNYNKGHQLGIDALALLRSLKPAARFELTLAGGSDDDATAALMNRAKALNVEDRVTVTGALSHDEVAEHMRRADIQLIPSLPRADGWVENFCTVASEGLASGLCVVAVNNGGVPEAVAGAGVLVPPCSAIELARGIVHAMDANTPAGWSELALARAAGYRDDDMLDDFERVHREAMEGSDG